MPHVCQNQHGLFWQQRMQKAEGAAQQLQYPQADSCSMPCFKCFCDPKQHSVTLILGVLKIAHLPQLNINKNTLW